jgi:aminopeptidase
MATRSQLERYAYLLVNYCVDLQPGERLFVQSTMLAAPLVSEIQRAVLRAGGHLEFFLSLEDQGDIMREEGNEAQFAYIPTLYRTAIEEFEAYINIRAPFNLRSPQSCSGVNGGPTKRASTAAEDLFRAYGGSSVEA